MPDHLTEPAREIPVACDADLCVIGGSCTGVFAAVRAARLGLSVALVEQNILFGGMAAAAQVNEWHSLRDARHDRKIIGGLTAEVIDRLRQRNVLLDLERKERGPYFLFNSAELALELDALVCENNIRPFLKTVCVGSVREGGRLDAALIEDKSGRRAIRARIFIDASGDGDLLRRAGFAAWKSDVLQPVSYQMVVAGLGRIAERTGRGIWEKIRDAAEARGYPPAHNSNPWFNGWPAPADLQNVYGPRLHGVDASDADQFTAAVLESRRCHRIILDAVREKLDPNVAAVSLAHGLGIRETWHAQCAHRLTADELLHGKTFPDAIASGTYPVDVHTREGTTLRYLDGREEFVGREGVEWRRWRKEGDPGPDFYQIPYRCLVPQNAENLLVAGRLLDADREAYGGLRVMVNMNQTGEAAGTAAALALRAGLPVALVDTALLRRTLADGGSLVA